jgi:FYVE zinc finger
MNLDNIPETVWHQLAATAIQRKPGDVKKAVLDRFYQIYENWSQHLAYEPGSEVEVRFRDAVWTEKVQSIEQAWKGKKRKEVKWDGYGLPLVQSDKDPVKARIGEEYNQAIPVARFQFLVKTGGGVNLFNTMKEACQLYIEEKLQGRTDECVVQMWKVFSESAGSGRSDSCVVYLAEPYTRPSVADLVENYIWPRVKGFVEDRLELIGFFRIGGKPIWALNLTQVSQEEQMACLGAIMLDSAGQCIGTVLGKAFAEAVKTFDSKAQIITAAKQNAKGLLYDLGLLSWRPDDSTKSCANCDEAFTFTNRRHHCRVCGEIFCGDCCQKVDIRSITRPVESHKGPEKGDVYVCNECHKKLTSAV